MAINAVDINCDMGESFGPYRLGLDEEVIKLVSSANVGCGFHGGDPHVMRQTVVLAGANGVGVGAHPGLPDLLGFGRRGMEISPQEMEDFLIYQIGALRAFCEAAGQRLEHVKVHGVLSDVAEGDEAQAEAMCRATKVAAPDLIWLAYAGTKTEAMARSMGLTVMQECYADRAYTREKKLASRKLPGAVIKNPEIIRARIAQLIRHGTVTTIDGHELEMRFQSIAVHGDTPGALSLVQVIRDTLAENDVVVKPLRQLLADTEA